MNIKIVFSALLCAAAGALASCSTETDTNTQDATNPDVTAKRTLSVDIPSTRSTVSLMDGNKWEDGDKFIAYNLTTPQGYDYITAETKANQQKLEGNVGCKQGDNMPCSTHCDTIMPVEIPKRLSLVWITTNYRRMETL